MLLNPLVIEGKRCAEFDKLSDICHGRKLSSPFIFAIVFAR